MWYLYFLWTPLFFNLIMVLMVIVQGSEVEAKRKTSFIEFFSTGRHHLILIQHLILTTILWEKYYHLNFAKTKGKLEEIIYFPQGTLQVGKTGFQFRVWLFFFFYKRPENKHFWLCGSHGLCYCYSPLWFYHRSSHTASLIAQW